MKPSDIYILVVDDEPLILEAVSDLFKKFNFKVDTACSGNKAFELFQKNSYDLVLTDVRMPDGDGIELTKKIKAKDTIRPSVLFMTGFSDLLNQEIYHIGAEGKFIKPFDSKAVRQAIQSCLLAPHLKWSQPQSAGGRVLTIEKVGNDIASLEAQRSVLFGRGGFFISHAFAPPEKGSTVLFSIEIRKPTPISFKGAGVVRWIQNHGRNNIPAGLGIEITKLSESDAKIYQELFGKVIPFIPSMSLLNAAVA